MQHDVFGKYPGFVLVHHHPSPLHFRPWQVALDDMRVFIDPDHRQAVWAMFDHLFSTVLCLNARRKLALQKSSTPADAGSTQPSRPATAGPSSGPRDRETQETRQGGGTPPLAGGGVSSVRHRRVQSDILPARSDRTIRVDGTSVAGVAGVVRCEQQCGKSTLSWK